MKASGALLARVSLPCALHGPPAHWGFRLCLASALGEALRTHATPLTCHTHPPDRAQPARTRLQERAIEETETLT